MDEIDRMDMPGYLKIRAWELNRKYKKSQPRKGFIDEVWPSVKP